MTVDGHRAPGAGARGMRAVDAPGPAPVGIVGCGHLGQGIARALLGHGLPPSSLLVSSGGSARTRARLAELGLAASIRDTPQVLQDARTVFVAVPPPAVGLLPRQPPDGDRTLASCVAGVPLSRLEGVLGGPVTRLMLSGPDSIVEGRALGALYPHEPRLAVLLTRIGTTLVPVRTEAELDEISVGVTLPAALLLEGDPAAIDAAATRLERSHPVLASTFSWARTVAPVHLDADARARYVARMATPGGITSAVVTSLRGGAPLADALLAGLRRADELSRL